MRQPQIIDRSRDQHFMREALALASEGAMLGEVPVGETSIVVGVSAGHRGPAFLGGEEVLEQCKERLEVWKKEVFSDGVGEWRANEEWDREGRRV